MILYAVRHARTARAEGPIGRADVPILGAHEDAAAAVVSALGARRPVQVWSSGLARCALTAELVAARVGVPWIRDERLLEIDYGEWEGRRWDELPRAETDRWMQGWEHVGPPGGESARTVQRRVGEWLATLDEKPQLVVAHAGVVRALRVLLGRMSWSDAMAMPVPHAGEPDALVALGREPRAAVAASE